MVWTSSSANHWLHASRHVRTECGDVLFVARSFAQLFFEWEEKVEGDVGRLEGLGFAVGDVVGEAAVGCEARCGCGCSAVGEGGGEASGEEAGGDGFCVAFNA